MGHIPLFRIIRKDAAKIPWAYINSLKINESEECNLSKIEEIAEKEAEAICKENGLYVYEVEYKKEGADYCLRIFIDSDEGVTLDQCEKVSRALSDKLDELDPIKSAYELEISSPGIERALTRHWHFEKAYGKEVEASLFESIDGEKKLRGILKSSDDETFTLINGDKEIKIEKNKTSGVKTVFKF